MSGNHLLALINDILDLSKAEAGKISLSEAPAAIADVARESTTMVCQQAGAASVALECNVAADLPPLMCDERLVKQILLNLLSNAIKFTPEGGSCSMRTSAARACASSCATRVSASPLLICRRRLRTSAVSTVNST